jgi:hypothetical protein
VPDEAIFGILRRNYIILQPNNKKWSGLEIYFSASDIEYSKLQEALKLLIPNIAVEKE